MARQPVQMVAPAKVRRGRRQIVVQVAYEVCQRLKHSQPVAERQKAVVVARRIVAKRVKQVVALPLK